MYSKIFSVFIFLVFDSINSESVFDSDDTTEEIFDIVPAHLKEHNFYLICKLQPNGYNCSERRDLVKSKFYFDVNMKTCMTFTYGHCQFSHNKFDTLQECNARCFESMQQDTSSIRNMTINMSCRLQPEFGNCQKYHPMYYFDVTTRRCRGFAFSGCGGNANRYLTESMCQKVCPIAVTVPKKALSEHHDHHWDI